MAPIIAQKTNHLSMTLLNENISFRNRLDVQTIKCLQDRLEHLQRCVADTYEAIIHSLIHALELHDGESRAHAHRVTELTLILARELSISDPELTYIRYGALLHDVGKIGVPGNILKKQESLTPEDWVIIKKHPQYALELLSSIDFLIPALDIPLYHHEHWDGSGYPHGLRGNEIPLAARIFAIVDVWDALRSQRAYRPEPWSKERVFSYIQQNAGSQFDPKIVETFIRVLKKSLLLV